MVGRTATTAAGPKKKSGPTERIEAIDKHVANRIRQARGLRGWTRETLARSVGASMQQVQKWEEAANRVFINHLWGISQALDYPVSWFFEGFIMGKSQEDLAQGTTRGDNAPDPLLMTRENLELLGVYSGLPNDRKRIVRLVTAEMGRVTSAESKLAEYEAADQGSTEAAGTAAAQA